MKIVHIVDEKYVEIKNKREIEEYFKKNGKPSHIELEVFPPRKKIKLKEPIYYVEMSMEELRLVSFYLELEKRKPIIDINICEKKEK